MCEFLVFRQMVLCRSVCVAVVYLFLSIFHFILCVNSIRQFEGERNEFNDINKPIVAKEHVYNNNNH